MRTTIVIGALIAVLCAPADARKPHLDLDAEPTHDGLYPIKRSYMRRAWAREDLDLEGYDKIMIVSGGIQYRPVKKVSRIAARSGTADGFPISEEQQETLREIVREQFTKALGEIDRFTFTDQPGPNTLILKAAIIDVVSFIPPEPMGRADFYLRSIGEATLVLEIVDSQSKAVLVRAADRRSAEQRGIVMESSRGLNRSQVRQVASQWARLLRNALQRVVEIDEEGRVVQRDKKKS